MCWWCWVPFFTSLLDADEQVVEGGGVPQVCADNKTVFIPKYCTMDDQGRIVKSHYCHLFWSSTAPVSCSYPAQPCVSTWQTTDNILEIDTSALAQQTCIPRDSGILWVDFARANPGANQWWIFRVLDKADIPLFHVKVPPDD